MNKRVYLPFMDRQGRLAMGLKPLQMQDWIEIDTDFADQLVLKNQLLAQRYSDVFASLPGSEVGQAEILELLLDHLLQYFPNYCQREGDRLLNRVTGQAWCLTDFETKPLDLAGRLVQEDLCLMLPGKEGYVLAAGSLCFPLAWQLREKLGSPMVQIHQPVPGYANKLRRPVDQFFDRLQPDFPGYRLSWIIVSSPDLFLEPQTPAGITSENAGERLWLRVERQAFRRLRRSNGILFTIRTYVYPLNQIADDPTVAHGLAAAIEEIPDAMQAYKKLLPIRTELLNYLDRQSAKVHQ